MKPHHWAIALCALSHYTSPANAASCTPDTAETFPGAVSREDFEQSNLYNPDGEPIDPQDGIDLDCRSGETCYKFTDDSLWCYNENTGQFRDNSGGAGNVLSAVYTASNGVATTYTEAIAAIETALDSALGTDFDFDSLTATTTTRGGTTSTADSSSTETDSPSRNTASSNTVTPTGAGDDAEATSTPAETDAGAEGGAEVDGGVGSVRARSIVVALLSFTVALAFNQL